MATKTKVTEVPFTAAGALMHFPERSYDYSKAVRLEVGFGWEVPPRVIDPDWRPNLPFRAMLMLKGSARGRSAAYFLWEDAAGREFPMFITDMTDLVRHETALRAGVATAWWMVAKRGQNYGVRLATDAEITSIPSPDNELEQP
jgi:hypothetical protein